MRILWITNIIMPEMAQALGLPSVGSGGWMASMLNQLNSCPDVTIAVATVSNKVNMPISKTINGVEYRVFPTKKKSWEYDAELEGHWKNLQKQFKPDVVHIHGTEFTYALAYIRACGAQNIVISIQGLVSEIGKVYYAGISTGDIKDTETISDKILQKGLRIEKDHFLIRGEYEKEYLNTVKYVIGRTEWDRSVVLGINPQLKYYVNNESLNNVFYENTWQYERCEPHTIFVSQCASVIKGFHILLKAMPLVLEKYPDVHIYVAGGNIVFPNTIKKKLTDTGYNVYLRKYIKQYGLKDKITFLGAMSADKMCKNYLRSNVFVMCSAIENSSNALGEAMLLGIPTISTSAAGNPSITQNGALSMQYDYEDYEQLAKHIITIFSGDYDKNMFVKAQEVARERHSSEKNADVLMSLYQDIISNK